MTEVTQYFDELLSGIPDAKLGKMFGALCAKMPNGKSGMMLKDSDLIIKTDQNTADKEGFKLFTPMENRPMNGWFVIPFEQKHLWKKYAEESCAAVAKLKENPKKPKKEK